MKRLVRPTRSFTLKNAIGQHTLVTFNVGPSGDVYVLLAVNPLDYRTKDNGFASFAKIFPDALQHYRVLVFRRGELGLDVAIRGERFNIHLVQPLGENLLLACSRSEYRRENDVDLNARVYSRDGRFIREFLLGDGLETVQATESGIVWASYFDEGVFGNYGWDDPVGASGLVAWSELGEKMVEFDGDGQVAPITDCYALNVAGNDDVWCCYYTDFPLVHLHKGRIASSWNVPVSGSHAFAVAGEHILFAGGYNKSDSLHLVRLAPDGSSRLIAEFTLTDEDGKAVKLRQTVGRGAILYVLSDAVIHEIDLNAVLTAHDRR